MCGVGSFCPGSKSTLASATRTSCGANKVTSQSLSSSVKECTVVPGYGWAASGATICPIGSYNPGYNTRACSKCPAGLTTVAAGANSTAACVAPAGSYYQRGAAVPCAQGTFKVDAGNADCSKCPLGFTTAAGAVGAKTPNACSCEWLFGGGGVLHAAAGDFPPTLPLPQPVPQPPGNTPVLC